MSLSSNKYLRDVAAIVHGCFEVGAKIHPMRMKEHLPDCIKHSGEFIGRYTGLPPHSGRLSDCVAINVEVCLIPDVPESAGETLDLFKHDSHPLKNGPECRFEAPEDVPEPGTLRVAVQDLDCMGEHVVEESHFGDSKEGPSVLRVSRYHPTNGGTFTPRQSDLMEASNYGS